jgi:hypothetical protein
MGNTKKIVTAEDWDRAGNAQRARMICRVISDKTMDQEKIKRLLDVAGSEDQIKLKVLHNAVVKCIKDYQAESTSARLNDWQKAEGALEAFIAELSAAHLQDSSNTLPNVPAIVEYLDARGWKAGTSTIYKHQKEGKIRPQQDGTFRIADCDKYAATYLKHKDGTGSMKLDTLQQEKLQAEIAKTKAQAEHWEIKAKASSGAYVPKELFERELARRAAVFRNDLENFARSEADGIVAAVEGDPSKVPDLIEYLLGRVEEFLDRYSREREFTVPLPPVSDDEESDHDEDEDEK